MTSEKEITCIVCPIGCRIQVKTDGVHAQVLGGNKCQRGISYAENEVLSPKRVITTSVLVEGGRWPLASVKTAEAVPKEKIFSVMEEIRRTKVVAPVGTGDVIIRNVAETGVNVVATRTVERASNRSPVR